MNKKNYSKAEALLVVSNRVAESLGVDIVEIEHILLAATIIRDKLAENLWSIDLTFENVNDKVFNNMVSKEYVLGATEEDFNNISKIKVCKNYSNLLNGLKGICRDSDINKLSLAEIFVVIAEEAASSFAELLEKMNVDFEMFLSVVMALCVSEGIKKGSVIKAFSVDGATGDVASISQEEMESVVSHIEEIAKKGSEKKKSRNPALQSFTVNLTDEARKGNLQKSYGREKEIARVIEILARKNKNNPCLVGEPGVGKTSVIEALSYRIIADEVPDFLKGANIYSLDISKLKGGTHLHGAMESRINSIISEISSNPKNILFIDELHVISSGDGDNSTDIGNLLKPCLSRGSVKCIGATTDKEYIKYIEKDGALERRFQKISIQELSEKDTLDLLKNCAEDYATHHHVYIPLNVLEEVVELSSKYVSDRYLPDKAFDLLDETCARVNVSNRESKTISIKDVADVLFDWTGIPTSSLAMDSKKTVLSLKDNLEKKIKGQELAVDCLSKVLIKNYSGLSDDTKPMGSFIFTGPTGVGKTALAKELAKSLFGSEKKLFRFDMSEYMDKISSSKLLGAAPGYVGYKEGGVLTEVVRKNPHCVVLFDEIEKSHPDVANVFLQILDNGGITDNKGRFVNFKNTIIIFTSNLVTKPTEKRTIGFPRQDDVKYDSKDYIYKVFSSHFSPEFVNRLDDIILFNELDKAELSKIVSIEISPLKKSLRKKGIEFTVTPKAREWLVSKCSKTGGARELKRIVSRHLVEDMSYKILSGEIKKGEKIVAYSKAGELLFKKKLSEAAE